MIWKRRRDRAVPEPAPMVPAAATVAAARAMQADSPAARAVQADTGIAADSPAVIRMDTGSGDPLDVARTVSGRGDRALDAVGAAVLAADTAEALASLEPRMIVRLDEHVRRWARPPGDPGTPEAASVAADRMRGGTAGPVAIALASMHRDGRVREDAVTRMAAENSPMWMPFLVLRSADWVAPVRARARTAVIDELAGAPAPHLGAALDMALLIGARVRGDFAHAQVVAALLMAGPRVREALLAPSPAPRRRFVFALGHGLGWWSPERIASLARHDRDTLVRAGAAEALCRAAVWAGDDGRLRMLAGSRYAQVRALAAAGLARLGHDTTVAGYLDDAGNLVRATARAAARRAGVDAHGHYRAVVAAMAVGGPARPGAIAGLAEIGSDPDAPLLHDLLGHPDSRVRAAAVGALRHLGIPPVARLLPLLRDPSPAVVLQATITLRPLPRAVPGPLVRELLADRRPEVRRAGYGLSRARGPAGALRAALLMVADPVLGGRAAADVVRTARTVTARHRWHGAMEMDADPAERAELLALIERVSGVIGGADARALTGWLTSGSVDD